MTAQYRRLVKEICEQRKWIEDCESNGVSYSDGERGQKIREADEAHLKGLLSTVELLPPSHRR